VTATLASALVGSLTQTPTHSAATNPSQVSTSNAGVVSQLVAGTAVNHQVSDQYGDGESFGLYQTIPVTVYASSPTTISLTALSVPPGAWVYFGATNSVTATPAGATATITMMGTDKTDPDLPESQPLVVGAGSGASAVNTTLYVGPNGFPFVAVRNASTSVIPNVRGLAWDAYNRSATDPWTFVYDPSDSATAPSSLSVSLQVLGLEVNGSVLQPMPSFLRVGFLNSTFTLDEYQPAFDAVHVWNSVVLTAYGSHQHYQVAVKETVDGLSQVAYVQVDIEGPLGSVA
jgi:hypothetical protein